MNPNRTTIKATLLAALIGSSAALSTARAEDNILLRDLSVEQRPIAGLAAQRSDLEVKVWTDRKNATYAQGETATILVSTNRDAYVTILDVGTSGKTHVIFPNKQQPDNRVEAHQVVAIPGEDAAFRLRVGGPAGRELIKVFASEEPLSLYRAEDVEEQGAFRSYRRSGELLTRDLEVELRRPREAGVTTANKILTILPRKAGKAKPAAHSDEGGPDELFQRGETAFYGEGGRGGANYLEALRLYMAAADAGHVQAMFRIARLHEEGRHLDRNPTLAVQWYKRAADLGNTQAMVRLALMHALGQGVEKSPAEAIRWLRQAANQNDGVAMLNLAKMHDEGVGVEKDPRAAAAYLLDGLKAGAWVALEQAKGLSESTRREVQLALKTSGLYAGAIDGQIGAETRAAMIELAKAA